MTKKVTIETTGRRDKQQILKEILRDNTANSISGPNPTFTPGTGSGGPECGGQTPEPKEPCADVSDILFGWDAETWMTINHTVYLPLENRRNHRPAAYGIAGAGNFEPAVDPATGPFGQDIYWSTSVMDLHPIELHDNSYKYRFVFSTEPGTSGTLFFCARYQEPPADYTANWSLPSSAYIMIAWDDDGFFSDTVRMPVSGGSQGNLDGWYEHGEKYVLEFTVRPNNITGNIWKQTTPEDAMSVNGVFTPALDRVTMWYGLMGGDEIGSPLPGGATIYSAAMGLVLGDEGCDSNYTTGQVYIAPLVRESYFFRPVPVPENSMSYLEVMFDGLTVFSGSDYTIEDNYKVVPSDSSLLDTIEVTARFVVG